MIGITVNNIVIVPELQLHTLSPSCYLRIVGQGTVGIPVQALYILDPDVKGFIGIVTGVRLVVTVSGAGHPYYIPSHLRSGEPGRV